MTFTFDEETADTLRRAASRLKKPQSVVVREAIQQYAAQADRLSDEERLRMLEVLDRMIARPAQRTAADVDAELKEIRATRRQGGRRSRSE
jgi:hypothetical protein